MTYITSDRILPLLGAELKLGDPCVIEITITPKDVFLRVGTRDWQWDKETGKFIGCGTTIS